MSKQQLETKFASIDIETTGLDPNTCQILTIGVVLDDLAKPLDVRPQLHIHLPRKYYRGEPFALHMNADILKHHSDILSNPEKYPIEKDINYFQNGITTKYLADYEVAEQLHKWLICQSSHHQKWSVTGKNYANFDDRFLSRLQGWKKIGFHHRILDPAMLYWNPRIDGSTPPNLKTCLERAGLDTVVTHDAVDDANQVANLILDPNGYRVILP